MLPVFQKIEANINHSFYVEQVEFPYFPNPLQFHPEIELLYVVKGRGTRVVGNSISRFGPGDLVMIGQNVPHVWYSEEENTMNNSSGFTEVIFILFKTEIFGEQFWNLPESKGIGKLIQQAGRGIRLTGKTRELVASLMKSIVHAKGFGRITILMEILEKIEEKKEFQYLTAPAIHYTVNQSDYERLNKVYKYVINNYAHEIKLPEAASVACLSTPAFCRYFKKRTNRTFVQFLNEIRIAFACRMLVEGNLPVAKVCYLCGFNNVSFFIRQFRGITGLTPLAYKKKFAEQ